MVYFGFNHFHSSCHQALDNQYITQIQESSPKPTMCSHHWPPPSSQTSETTHSPNSRISLRKIRRNPTTPVGFTESPLGLLAFDRRRMLHEARHRLLQSPSLARRKALPLQLHNRRCSSLRRPMAQPPPHHDSRDLLLISRRDIFKYQARTSRIVTRSYHQELQLWYYKG